MVSPGARGNTVLAIVVLLLLATACGGDDDASDTGGFSGVTTATPTATPAIEGTSDARTPALSALDPSEEQSLAIFCTATIVVSQMMVTLPEFYLSASSEDEAHAQLVEDVQDAEFQAEIWLQGFDVTNIAGDLSAFSEALERARGIVEDGLDLHRAWRTRVESSDFATLRTEQTAYTEQMGPLIDRLSAIETLPGAEHLRVATCERALAGP